MTIMIRKTMILAATTVVAMDAASAQPKKNVLFIAVDDLRGDWISPAKGPGSYPGIITPNIQRMADSGITFSRAYTPAPWCCPSRTALLTGVLPSQSGVYHHMDDAWRESPVLKDVVTLPQYFRENGYWTVGAGKVFHHADASQDPRSWDQYYPNQRNCMNYDKPPQDKPLPACGAQIREGFDWAPLDRPEQEMADWKVADYVIQQLKSAETQDKPFFLACGIYRPHLPGYTSKKYYDLYPLDKITIPETMANDLDDVPPMGREFALGDNLNAKIAKAGLVKQAIQQYLAGVTFADECIGRVLDALDKSPFRDNTIVVLWSDNGWQFSEKEHWEKVALWRESCSVVLQIRVPGVTLPGSSYAKPVSLMDIYPTLIRLCGLPSKMDLAGMNLMPILKDPEHQDHPPVLATLGRGNHAVFSDRWEYIRYRDGTEELYDLQNDPYEWKNTASNPEYSGVKKQLGGYMPVQSQEATPLKIKDF
jgi:arylsulfatase A-like enzyme